MMIFVRNVLNVNFLGSDDVFLDDVFGHEYTSVHVTIAITIWKSNQ